MGLAPGQVTWMEVMKGTVSVQTQSEPGTTEGSDGQQEAEAERYQLRNYQPANRGQGRDMKDQRDRPMKPHFQALPSKTLHDLVSACLSSLICSPCDNLHAIKLTLQRTLQFSLLAFVLSLYLDNPFFFLLIISYFPRFQFQSLLILEDFLAPQTFRLGYVLLLHALMTMYQFPSFHLREMAKRFHAKDHLETLKGS